MRKVGALSGRDNSVPSGRKMASVTSLRGGEQPILGGSGSFSKHGAVKSETSEGEVGD